MQTKTAPPQTAPQEIEPSKMEQLLDKVLQKVTDTEARVARLEVTKGRLAKDFKGTQLADMGFAVNIRFMEILVSEATRTFQNMDKGQLQAFAEIWPRYVDAVTKGDVAKWIAAREKQGHHEPTPLADATPGA